jgi:hypothetical protein
MKPNSVKHAIWLKQSCLGGFRWFRSVHRSYPIAAERRRWDRIGNLTTKLAAEIRLLPRQAPWSTEAMPTASKAIRTVPLPTSPRRYGTSPTGALLRPRSMSQLVQKRKSRLAAGCLLCPGERTSGCLGMSEKCRTRWPCPARSRAQKTHISRCARRRLLSGRTREPWRSRPQVSAIFASVVQRHSVRCPPWPHCFEPIVCTALCPCEAVYRKLKKLTAPPVRPSQRSPRLQIGDVGL